MLNFTGGYYFQSLRIIAQRVRARRACKLQTNEDQAIIPILRQSSAGGPRNLLPGTLITLIRGKLADSPLKSLVGWRRELWLSRKDISAPTLMFYFF